MTEPTFVLALSKHVASYYAMYGGFSYVSIERRADIGERKFWVILGEAMPISVESDIF
jgi:hypothetical protein